MSEHQIHFDRKFYKDKKTGYWISTVYPRIRAHQWIWIKIHGLIPKGYHIHHKNEEKSDNRIENLELIAAARHLSHHMNDPDRKQKSRENLEKIRPKTIEWHKSEEGRAWHRIHAIKTKFGNGPKNNYICHQCSNRYQSKLICENRTLFCSNPCKSKWRRNTGLDDIEKICPVCKKKYMINKYSKSKTCGRSCGKKLMIKHKDISDEKDHLSEIRKPKYAGTKPER